ncbi:hypothetical protein ACOJBO_07850 [Rhizobium beringeri]
MSLRAHLGGLLPDHMVPSASCGLEAQPLTMNGKPDRKALPVPATMSRVRSRGAAGERSRRPLADLGRASASSGFGANDNFFELAATRCWRFARRPAD